MTELNHTDEKSKILIASDSMKGTLSSAEIIEVFKKVAARFADVEVDGVPVADGGEGSLDAVLSINGFEEIEMTARDPLGNPVRCRYALSDGGVAFIEMAEPDGLPRIPKEKRDLRKTTTYGTGELIANAIKRGAKEILVAVGGSATNDGGIGALGACGIKFLDKNRQELEPIAENLGKISHVDMTSKIGDGVSFTVLADVDNPLVGKEGATFYYGRQKGGSEEDLVFLESGMRNYAAVTKEEIGVSVADMPHAGAAGGLAGGLMAYFGAEAKSGIEAILGLTEFDKRILSADYIVTGEGMIDDQSRHGKAISGVCAHAAKRGIPVVAMVGASRISPSAASEMGLKKIYTLLSDSADAEDSINNARYHAERVAEKILNDLTGGNV